MTHIPTLWDFVFKQLQDYNVTSLTYYHLPGAGAHDLDTPYIEYRSVDNKTPDMVPTTIFDVETSFIFRSRSIATPESFTSFAASKDLTKSQRDLFEKLHLSNQKEGLVIASHGANGRTGLFILETTSPLSDMNDFNLRVIQWLVDAAHYSYSEIRKTSEKKIKRLSVREKQILTWVAKGKSNSVIADIVGISPHTVNGYLRSIYLKTGTSDRTTAVLRGLGDGLIDL